MIKSVKETARFIQHAIKRYRTVGAVAPSSRFLAKAMCGQIDWAKADFILELGPGTGVFTREIIRRKKSSARLILLEKEKPFANALKAEFPEAEVINGDVAHIGNILESIGVGRVDAVLSGLPVLFIPEQVLKPFYAGLKAKLAKEYRLIQFTYAAGKFKKITTEYFRSVEVKKFVPFNIPPAYVLKLELK